MTEVRFRNQAAERFAVRLVPISASQIEALESLERAFTSLANDFWRDYGSDHDDRIAGGLYRLCSTLEMVIAQWRDSEDVAVVETQRQALERIAHHGLTTEQARTIAARALEPTRAPE